MNSSALCEFCGSARKPAYEVRLGNRGTAICACPQCRSFQTDPLFSEEEIRQFYQESYFGGHAWEINKAKTLAQDYFRKVERACGKDPLGTKALEIGAGFGFFAELLGEKQGLAVDVAEPSQRCRDHLRKRNFSGKIFKSLESIPPTARYAEVFCFHVVEHLQRLGAFLERIAKILEAGGRLWILTPNGASRVFNRLSGSWGWACPEQHYQFLSLQIPESYYQTYGFELLVAKDIQPAVIHYPSWWRGFLIRWWRNTVVGKWPRNYLSAADKTGRLLGAGLERLLGQNRTNYNLCLVERISATLLRARPYDELLVVLKRSKNTPPANAPD